MVGTHGFSLDMNAGVAIGPMNFAEEVNQRLEVSLEYLVPGIWQ